MFKPRTSAGIYDWIAAAASVGSLAIIVFLLAVDRL